MAVAVEWEYNGGSNHSQTVSNVNKGRWPANRSYVDLYVYLDLSVADHHSHIGLWL